MFSILEREITLCFINRKFKFLNLNSSYIFDKFQSIEANFSFYLQTWRDKVVVTKQEEHINLIKFNFNYFKKADLYNLNSIPTVFKIFLHLRDDINVSVSYIHESVPLIFEKTLVIFKIKGDMVKAHWDKIGVTFKDKLSQENILFLENYVKISNLETIKAENLKKEN